MRGFAGARRIDARALLADINTGLKGKLSRQHDALVSPDATQL